MSTDIKFDYDNSYVLEMAAVQSLGSRQISNVFHIAVQNDSSASLAASEAANRMKAAWLDLSTQLSKSWRLTGFTYRLATEAPTQSVDVPIGDHVVGASGSALLPPRTTMIVAFKTGEFTPKRSLKYLSGFTEATNEREGFPSTKAVEASQAWGDTFVTWNTQFAQSNLDADMLTWCFTSVKKEHKMFEVLPEHGNWDGSATVVTHWKGWRSAIARNRWRSLRRRG